MMTGWGDFDRTFSLLDEVRRRMDRVWDDVEPGLDKTPSLAPAGWPRLNVYDTGAALVLQADVPGLSERDVTLTLHDKALTLTGERRLAVPEGMTPQRQERLAARFSRTVSLPVRVDAERTTATVKDGVLTVTLAKALDAQPRAIPVKAGA